MSWLTIFRKKQWTNWGGNFSVKPFELTDTSSLTNEAISRIFAEAVNNRGLVKIVGSGHSFSDILHTDGSLLYRSNHWFSSTASIIEEVDKTVLNDTSEQLIYISGRAKLSEINTALKNKGFAFNNLGSAVLQTYAGAISTSTHGTGTQFAPLCDDVRSITLLLPQLGLCRLEPTNGITNSMRFEAAYPAITLLQNDDLYYAALVAMGCMGIVLGYITSVTTCYKLRETRKYITWSRLKKELREKPAKYFSHRHFDIILNPYLVNGEYSCVVTIRQAVPHETPNTRDLGKFIRWIVAVFQKVIGRFLNYCPCVIPRVLDLSIKSLVKKQPYIDESTEIFDIDLINKVRAVSAEYFIPMENNIYLAAIDDLLRQVDSNTKKGMHHNSPIGIRFTAPSKAYLSMAYGKAMCTIETPLLANTKGWRTLFKTYERVCLRHGGRPHWGQYNELTGKPGWLIESYPKATAWLAALQQLDPAGVFRNRFTKRMGFRYNNDK